MYMLTVYTFNKFMLLILKEVMISMYIYTHKILYNNSFIVKSDDYEMFRQKIL